MAIKKEEASDSEVSFWLSHYDDLFSDFDHRSYSRRAISDDFLIEARKFTGNKDSEKLELRFLIPTTRRDKNHEPIIKKRLQEHFRRHYHLLLREHYKIRRRGLTMTSTGMILLAGATVIAIFHQSVALEVVMVLLQPAGWFLTWMGLELFFFTSQEKGTELKFYERMNESRIVFQSD